jgi:hypothetical protein
MKLGEVIFGAVIAAGVTAAFVAISGSPSSSTVENYRGYTCTYLAPVPGTTPVYWSATGAPLPTSSIQTSFTTSGADLASAKTALHALIDAAITATNVANGGQ